MTSSERKKETRVHKWCELPRRETTRASPRHEGGFVACRRYCTAEYTNTSGNFTTVTRRILEKIPPQDDKRSYGYDRYIFHYIVDDGITYLCMADEESGKRIPFAFLEDIKNRFRATYGDRGKTAIAYGMNTDFSRVLQNQMEFYSNNPSADRITKVRGEIDEVKSVMVQNIEKVLERGERIELLVDKTENLNQNAFKFKKASTQLKRSMWWKNIKIMVILVLVIVVVVYFIVAMACKGLLLQNCVKKAKDIAHSTTSTSITTATATASTSTATDTSTGSTMSDSTGTSTGTNSLQNRNGGGGGGTPLRPLKLPNLGDSKPVEQLGRARSSVIARHNLGQARRVAPSA